MKGPVGQIVECLAGHLAIPVDLILFGGAAMTLAYRYERPTEDVDILIREADLQIYAENGLGDVLEKVNEDLRSRGFYIRHLWSPSQEVLTQGWEARLVRIPPWWHNPLLQLRALSPIDLVASKLVRFDRTDREDIRYLIGGKWISKGDLECLPSALVIPPSWENEAKNIRQRAQQLAFNGVC